jgi:uncharacterized membrane protein
MSEEDEERWWNYIIFHLPVTNKTRDEILPFMAIGFILLICIVAMFGGFNDIK